MKNSHKTFRDRFAGAELDRSSMTDEEIAAEIALKREERDMLQDKREELRLRVVSLSAEIATLEAIGPVRRLQRKLGGIDHVRGSGDIRLKAEPATVNLKGRAPVAR